MNRQDNLLYLDLTKTIMKLQKILTGIGIVLFLALMISCTGEKKVEVKKTEKKEKKTDSIKIKNKDAIK